MSERTQAIWRKMRGSVSLEFAVMIPFLLVLFLFAWDVIFYFNYEILGSYAAFAASRSYAVFQDEKLAGDVAAAVMSCATIPVAGDEDRAGYGADASEGVQSFLQKAKAAGFLPGENAQRNPFASARARINFHVGEVDTGIGMRKGYTYAGPVTVVPDTSGGWFSNILEKIGLAKAKDRNLSVVARVAHVTMTYDYPVLMGYLRKPSFVVPQGMTNLPASFHIYNACACPIEPKPTALLETNTVAATTNEVLTVAAAEELARLDLEVKKALTHFYAFASGVHQHYSGDLQDAQAYTGPDWLVVDRNSVGRPQGNYFSGERRKAGTEVWWPILGVSTSLETMPTQMRKSAFVQPRVPSGFSPLSAYPVFEEKLDEIYEVQGLFHPQYTLTLDIEYRRHVKRRILDELDGLNGAIARMNSAKSNIIQYLASQGVTPAPGAAPIPNYLGRASRELGGVNANVRSRLSIPSSATAGNALSLLGPLDTGIATAEGWVTTWNERLKDQQTAEGKSTAYMLVGFGTQGWQKANLQQYFGKYQPVVSSVLQRIPEMKPDNEMEKIRQALRNYYIGAARAGAQSTSGMDDVLRRASSRNKEDLN